MPSSNVKQDIHTINAHIKFGETPLTFTQVIIRKQKYRETYNRLMEGQPM